MRGLCAAQRLSIGVGGAKFHMAQAGLDHAVDGVAAASADADDADNGRLFSNVFSQFDSH